MIKHQDGLLAIGLSLLGALLSLFAPYALVKVVDNGISTANVYSLFIWLAASVLAMILAAIFRQISQVKAERLSLKIENNKRDEIYKSALKLNLASTRRLSQGDLMGRCLLAAESERDWTQAKLNTIIPVAVSLFGVSALLFYFSWRLALLAFLPFPLTGLFLYFLRKKIRKRANENFESQGLLYAILHESLRSLDSIQALNISDKFNREFSQINDNASKRALQYVKTSLWQLSVLDILQAALIFAVFGMGGYFIIHGQGLTIGELLGFQIYLAKIFSALRSLGSLFNNYQNYSAAKKRADELKNIPPQPQRAEKYSENMLIVENAAFAFNEKTIFESFNLQLQVGKNLAIIANSGWGKTTLAYCLLGLYPLKTGTITLPKHEKHCFALVAQEHFLFSRSLQENIELASGALSKSQMQKVLHCAALEKLAKSHGLDFQVGEEGRALSGGERKRVLLARALALNPKILLIDQLSSDLEPAICETIFTRIHTNYPQMSVIYFGHRIPEGFICDETLKLHKNESDY